MISPVAGSGQLHYAIGAAPFQSVAMSDNGQGQSTAQVPVVNSVFTPSAVEVAAATDVHRDRVETLMTALTTTDVEPKLGSMGMAAPGLTLAVIGDDGHRLPDGEVGHVALLTPCPTMMLGYWNDPDRTEQSHVVGREGRWFLTGDLASRDADG